MSTLPWCATCRAPRPRRTPTATTPTPTSTIGSSKICGGGIDRATAKALNFCIIYGGGAKVVAEMSGKTEAEATAFMRQYNRQLPFAARAFGNCAEGGGATGYTVLLDGARRHWNLWEVPFETGKGKDVGPCPREEAERRKATPGHRWYRKYLSRYKVYTALNALIQGSAARHTKKWMKAVLGSRHRSAGADARLLELLGAVARTGGD